VTPSGANSATYVFCLVQSPRPPSLRGVPDSVPGAGAVRVLSITRDLWAVVADAPLDRFSSDHLEQDLHDLEMVSRHALAHAAVVEFFFRTSPVIPLKIFTLFSTDERVRQDLVGRATSLRKLFAQLRGFEEWGVRITADPRRAERAGQPPASGRDYLVTKKRLLDESDVTPNAIVKEVGAALKTLGRLAAKVRKEAFPPPGRNRPFVIGASFLVNAKKRGPWKKRVATVAAALGKHGHRLEVSGPWPPYHFASSGK
jgi:gas vesicle protein GvpL/GvpF